MEFKNLSQYFREYYIENKLMIPDLLFQREIGFIPFDGTMVRHKMFNNEAGIEKYVRYMVPRHLYYSSAYYRYPEQHTMAEKEWLGAELIFDLDADHIEGADKMTYVQILDEVKKHTMKLLNMLQDDFGFDEKNIKLYFSGGRGYHVHIESERVYELDSDARREIGDYIRMENLNIDELKKLDDVYFEYGVLKKLNIYISDFFNNIDENYVKNIFRKDTIHYLKYINNKYYKEKKIIDFLKNQNGNKFKLIGKEDSNIKYNELILKSLLNNFKKASMAEIDEPVTTDIHRLIRFPLSLHGKTGLMVKPLKIGDLKDFMPLNDAIPDVFKNGSRKINLGIDKFEITMNNENYKVEKGINEAPLYLAIFAVAINVAEFVD